MRRAILSIVLLCSLALTPALASGFGQGRTCVDPNSLPQQGQARVGEDGQIIVKWYASCMVCEPVVREVAVAEERVIDGKTVKEIVTQKVTAMVCKTKCFPNEFRIPAAEAKFFDLEGKPVAAEKAAEILKKETTILYANRVVPSYYLSIFKPGTLFLKCDPSFVCAPPVAMAPAPAVVAPPLPPAEGAAPAPVAPAPPAKLAPAPAPAPPREVRAVKAVPGEAAPGPAEGPALPTGAAPHPTVSLAKVAKDSLALRTFVKEIDTEYVEHTQVEKGQSRVTKVAVETESIVDVERRFPWSVVTAYRADGKEITKAEMPKIFADSRCVLVSADTQKVDAALLEIVKPDTVIVILPPSPPPVFAAPAPVRAIPAPAPAPGSPSAPQA